MMSRNSPAAAKLDLDLGELYDNKGDVLCLHLRSYILPADRHLG